VKKRLKKCQKPWAEAERILSLWAEAETVKTFRKVRRLELKQVVGIQVEMLAED
jgi:hypothetical protein